MDGGWEAGGPLGHASERRSTPCRSVQRKVGVPDLPRIFRAGSSAAIADSGSLTAAARALHSSLPAVVRSLAALEAHLGVRLFQRSTRRISLTQEGKRYLENCRLVLAAVALGEASLAADAGEPTGLLTITAPVLFGQMYVAPAIMRLLRRYEKMQVKVLLLSIVYPHARLLPARTRVFIEWMKLELGVLKF
jgi:DNA-binding transcriptional LysR family regulator